MGCCPNAALHPQLRLLRTRGQGWLLQGSFSRHNSMLSLWTPNNMAACIRTLQETWQNGWVIFFKATLLKEGLRAVNGCWRRKLSIGKAPDRLPSPKHIYRQEHKQDSVGCVWACMCMCMHVTQEELQRTGKGEKDTYTMYSCMKLLITIKIFIF